MQESSETMRGKPVAKGLDGVFVDTTRVADVRPSGVLSYRGQTIDELVRLPFGEVAALLVGQQVDVSMTSA